MNPVTITVSLPPELASRWLQAHETATTNLTSTEITAQGLAHLAEALVTLAVISGEATVVAVTA